jgi:hypothetical protein
MTQQALQRRVAQNQTKIVVCVGPYNSDVHSIDAFLKKFFRKKFVWIYFLDDIFI